MDFSHEVERGPKCIKCGATSHYQLAKPCPEDD